MRLQNIGKGWQRGGRWLAGAAAGVALLQLTAGVAGATGTDPFTQGMTGYDAAWPQCPSTPSFTGTPPAFAIIGVTGGRPFSKNSCAATLISQAVKNVGSANVSFYFNTGYSGAYGRDIMSICSPSSNAPVPSKLSRQGKQAWEEGCSEVAYAESLIPSGVSDASLWADVETGNSWSTNTILNKDAIDGIDYGISAFGPKVGGIYTDVSSWSSLTGNYAPTTNQPAFWLAGFANCPSTSLSWASLSQIWLVQTGTASGVDQDLACPA